MATNILLLGASGFIAVGMFRLTDPILPKIAEDFGTSVGSVATTMTAFIIGYGLFQLLHGPLGDRVGKLRVITGALALASLATIACAWANTVPALSALRFAAGMTALRWLGERRMVLTGGSLAAASYLAMTASPAWQLFVPAMALVGLGFFCMHGILQLRATEIAPEARGTALTGFVLFMFLGQGSGVYGAGYLVDGPGYRATFAIAAVTIVLLMLWLYRALFASHQAKN